MLGVWLLRFGMRCLAFEYSLLMPAPPSSTSARGRAFNDDKNAFPQNAYSPNVETILKLFLQQVSRLFFMIEKVASNVNMSDDLPN